MGGRSLTWPEDRITISNYYDGVRKRIHVDNCILHLETRKVEYINE